MFEKLFPFRNIKLGGGFNPIEKYARQIGSFPQIEVKMKNMSNHHLDGILMVWICLEIPSNPYLPTFTIKINQR